MSTGPDIARRRTGAVITAVAVASALLVLLAGGLGLAALYYWTQYVPPRLPRTWTELVMVSYSDGTVTYSVNGRKVTTKAELTEELRKARARWPLDPGDTVLAEFMIFPYIMRSGEDGITREDFEMARAACRAAGVRSKGLEKPPSLWLNVSVRLDESGLAHYESGKRIDALGERELGRQMARVVRERGDVEVSLGDLSPLSGVTRRHIEAAKVACEAAGAVVKEMPKQKDGLPDGDHDFIMIKGRPLTVRAVGVCNGLLQFRLGNEEPVVSGEAELTKMLRDRIAEEEAQAGGVSIFNVSYEALPELVIPDDRRRATRAAIKAAGPGVFIPFGYRFGGGRRSSFVKQVRVQIVDAVQKGGGSKYLLDGEVSEGEEALRAGLVRSLGDWRAGKENPALYTLDVDLKVEVKPGITATEEQIARARETIKAAGVGRPEKAP